MKKLGLSLLLAALAFTAYAHFQVIMPPTDIVKEPATICLDILFTHPMEQGPVMDMARPRRFGVLLRGKNIDLLPTLQMTKTEGKSTCQVHYDIKEPGDHIFYVEPSPYYEPAEKKMIVHYTKVVVNAMGMEQGWDAMAGLPVEIEPLTRPYGLWTGNEFRGIVKVNGKPQPFARVEVEHWNEGKKVGIPADPFVTQVIKADANGTFSYSMPRSGWWAFAALVDADQKMKNPEGEMVPVELGGLIWVRTVDMK